MKIGIITFWNSQDNYGQLLQCFALQHYLKRQGHDPFLIRYIPQVNNKSKLDRILGLWKVFSPLHLIAYKRLKQRILFDKNNPRYFDDFRKQHIEFSSNLYYSFDDLNNEKWDVDAFICGSDQIWSYSKNHETIKSFFLQFAPSNVKVIAYAASFGRSELPKVYSEMLPELLKKFDLLGIREESGVDLCFNANRKDAVLVCDPTILLNGDDFIKSIVNKEIVELNSVFIYLLNWETNFPLNEINDYLAENELKSTFFGANGMELKNIFKHETDLSINSWMQSLASSKFSFTNSFHGTVLSILLKRPFICFPLIGESAKMNDRISTLLKKVGLENRIYSSNNSINEILESPIDWFEVEKRLNDFRTESELFLDKALR